MPLVRERQSNLIRIIYSIGAVILLIASLFFVLEWSYAKELFGLGLFLEIIVFTLTLIEPRAERSTEEIIFKPKNKKPLQSELKDSRFQKTNESYDSNLEQSIAKLTNLNEQLAKTLQKVELNYQDNLLRTSQLEQRMEKLQLQIRKTNEQLNKLTEET